MHRWWQLSSPVWIKYWSMSTTSSPTIHCDKMAANNIVSPPCSDWILVKSNSAACVCGRLNRVYEDACMGFSRVRKLKTEIRSSLTSRAVINREVLDATSRNLAEQLGIWHRAQCRTGYRKVCFHWVYLLLKDGHKKHAWMCYHRCFDDRLLRAMTSVHHRD
jgi:hypothetical protein